MTITRRSPLFAALGAAGSLWFAAVLLVLLFIAMACATVHESEHGAGAALREFYHAEWFFVLLCLLAVNVLASLLVRVPFKRAQTGFVITHASLLVTFGGALVTKYYGVTDGRAALAEGQSVTQFARPGDLLTIRRNPSGEAVRREFTDAVEGVAGPVERTVVPTLTLDELHVEATRFYPDSAWRRLMHDDNEESNPAIEASFGPPRREGADWIFAGTTSRIKSVPIGFRGTGDRVEVDAFMDSTGETNPKAKGRISVEHLGRSYEFTVEEGMEGPVPLGETGLSARVRRYFPHASVNAENKIVNLSDQPVNPYVEVEIAGAGVSEIRKSFARFPNFQSMHGGAELEDLRVTLSTDERRSPIEVLAGPEGEFYVRFAHGDDPAIVRKLKPGTPIETPWANYRFAITTFYERAREEWTLTPKSPPSAAPTPALLLKCAMGDQSRDVWLQKYQSQAVTIDQRSYEIAYTDIIIPLEFTLKLDKFRVGTYPGTQRPRSFESHVTATLPTTGRELSHVISMNHPAKFGGYTLFQSSYDMDRNRPVSYLSVSSDPGQPFVFAGYFGVMIGMTTVLITRLAKRRSHDRATTAVVRAGAAALVLWLGASTASAADAPKNLDVTALRGIPTQHDGRWPPLDTTARDLAETITGDSEHRGIDPVLTLLSWTFEAESWTGEPLIVVEPPELREALELPESQVRFSYADLFMHAPLHQAVQRIANSAGARMTPLDSKIAELNQKVELLGQIFIGQALRLRPNANDIGGAWGVISQGHGAAAHGRVEVQTTWEALGEAFRSEDAAAFSSAAIKLRDLLLAAPAAYRPSARLIEVELRYNRLRPFRTAWIIMAFGAAVSALSLLVRRKWFDAISILVMLAGFATLTYGLSLRWQIAGRIPAANMYESLLFLSWGMGAFAIVAMFVQRQRVVPLTASFMGALALFLSDVLPMDGYIRPIPPVLLDTIWMSIHVPIIMVSYSVLALAMLIAHVQIIVMSAAPQKRETTRAIDTMHYYYVTAGSIFLAAGIITGSMWAASSWGRYWGWDPKEVWSLIAFLGYMAILHVRVSRERVRWWMYVIAGVLGAGVFAIATPLLAPYGIFKIVGVVGAALACCVFVLASGPFADALKSITAFWMIVMTYLGVNYVLGTGLHSYGFGMGAVAEKMLIVGGIDLALMALCTAAYLVGREGNGIEQTA